MARRKGPGLTRKDVVEAALQCVEKHGAAALGINRVARMLGIKPPSLYNHVSSNEDLHRAAALAGFDRLSAHFARISYKPGEEREFLIAHGHCIRDFARSHKELYRHMSNVSLDPKEPEVATILNKALSPLERALAPMGLDGDEAVHAMRALRSAAHGFALLELDGQFRLGTDPEQSFDWMMEHLVDSFPTNP